MDRQLFTGKISFIDHDKGYATIAYVLNGKNKTIKGNVSKEEQSKLRAEKIIKKIHRFHIGDEVSFVINSSPRGDRMIADCIEFRYNNALESLINKTAIENRLVGYLKKVEDEYFVKETGSYIFFPLKLSPWEKGPSDDDLNEPFFFKLENTDKPDNAFAVPFKSLYIPEFQKALQCFKNKTTIDATIYKITPHGIFVNLFSSKIGVKIPISEKNDLKSRASELKVGDHIKARITYINPLRIIVETV